MELLATLAVIAIAGAIFGAVRSKRKRDAREEIADLRSAANTASIFILGGAARGGLRPDGDATAHAAHGANDVPHDIGGGIGGGGDFGGGGDSGGM